MSEILTPFERLMIQQSIKLLPCAKGEEPVLRSIIDRLLARLALAEAVVEAARELSYIDHEWCGIEDLQDTVRAYDAATAGKEVK